MKYGSEYQYKGFTIVELLIVIVVIAILSVVTIVAYNGIRDSAIASQAQSALAQANRQVMLYAAEHSDQLPASLSDADVTDTGSVSYQYSNNNTVTPREYCVTATVGDTSFYTSSDGTTGGEGICPGHNLIVWSEPAADSQPVTGTGISVSTSMYASAPASIQIAPNNVMRPVRGVFAGEPGQVVTVTAKIRTDSNWDGTGGHSKFRFREANNGAYIAACGYEGPKTSWTNFSCSTTLTVDRPAVELTVGNDGTTGNVWLDDIHVSVK